MAANTVSVSSEFDIFADRAIQTSTLNTDKIAYKPIASIDQSYLEFVIPEYDNSYIDLNIQIYIKGQLIGAEGAELDSKD
jgi:hypothetical protein